jgi:hypothetical protein
MTVPHTTTAVHTCPGHAVCDAMTREGVSLHQLTQLRVLRTEYERAAASFTHLDESVHNDRYDGRPPATLVRLRDVANGHCDDTWQRLKRYERANPAVVRALDALEVSG